MIGVGANSGRNVAQGAQLIACQDQGDDRVLTITWDDTCLKRLN